MLAAKRIVFNNSSGSLSPVVPSATANPRDVVAYPSASEGFTNLTTNNQPAADAQLVGISEDGRTVALLSQDRSKEGGASFQAPAASLFSLTDDAMRLLARARTVAGPIVEATLARRGGSAAISTLSDLGGVNGGTNLAHRAVFYLDGTSGAATMLTTGGSAAADSIEPAVGQEGKVVVFSSANIYDQADGAVPAAFANLKTLAGGGRGIFRYSVGGGANAYRNGWVTKSLGEEPVCGKPRSATEGTFVAFQGRQLTYKGTLNTVDQIYLAVANPGAGTPWLIGAITQDPALSSGNLSMAEGAVGVGSFPPLVFESAGDYRGRRPSAVALTDPTFSTGATAAGNLSFRAIYLFPGSFSENLVLVARGSDADCLNPRISPDGTEVVFESAATQILAPVSSGPPELEHRVVNGSKLNRIYRARVRTLATSQGSPSSIVERITPEGVDVGSPARPAIAR